MIDLFLWKLFSLRMCVWGGKKIRNKHTEREKKIITISIDFGLGKETKKNV